MNIDAADEEVDHEVLRVDAEDVGGLAMSSIQVSIEILSPVGGKGWDKVNGKESVRRWQEQQGMKEW